MEVDEMKPAAASRLKISDDVIIAIARLAALDVKGVAKLGGEVGKMSKLRKNGPIKISMMGDVAAIDMKIVVKSGEKACNIAQEVQTVVKENVQNMTGVPVARVNVTVSGVVFE
ncbi:MAG: Asp23/Gls24 family envelope stress response protein [Ruminococcus sp.]|uniref:Asp23/Gls24 family envelope stress response protein n=1 Tax=Ruminococcus sp. TaxID=41978 RepID=UPI00156A7093|nr:Asp23/Gls24 family envelope stress response protein [Ruminococcus sp.]MCR5599370.1 Asp23/Gls24 family envelope stress response protein [Ruminococcus sp.]